MACIAIDHVAKYLPSTCDVSAKYQYNGLRLFMDHPLATWSFANVNTTSAGRSRHHFQSYYEATNIMSNFLMLL
eukprot:scaffold227568_cov25-Prasinocladus_malaysianus.AAC.1